MAAQLDLFGTPLLPGLSYGEEVLDAPEEAALVAAIDACELTPFRFQGWTGKRLTTSFGWSYDFDRGRIAPGVEIPAFRGPLRERAAAFAGMPAAELEQALLIRYDPGAGIGWHRDRPMFEHVVGISLGEPAVLRLRRRTDTGFERRSLTLAPRSIYHLSGEARHAWEHGIAAMERTRWSVTFRSLSALGRRAAALAQG
ncbi:MULTISPECIES: alpha-ketoglutarate-dependent dioxygenase AlkB [Sphingomonas]|uniref:Alpha-ketoglutarate-dependent dioxygenase AlkB n=1 Tax=Sphingomonas molluscorum TaxID=418184 RepID=A0ABU8Q8D6_9SPHN|nr:alpha-ketoglutarate-dependent dioxygenase AlkB [Sphingomonas sp. JUb134]MBM7407300.1 alkylated DNA repair dioxygenase AlkB [Sphingomonas sp. JUb134]